MSTDALAVDGTRLGTDEGWDEIIEEILGKRVIEMGVSRVELGCVLE